MNDVFDKEEWIADLKQKKMTKEDIIQAFHYVGDIFEDVLSVVNENSEAVEQLQITFREHKHCDGKVVKEV